MIAALVLVALGFALAVWAFGGRGGPRAGRIGLGRRNPCTWRETGYRNGRMHEFRCDHCGIAGFGRDGTVPKVCKRGLGR